MENKVAVRFRSERDEKVLFSKTALITTPAPPALKMLEGISEAGRRYLASLDYREGTVAALGFKDARLPDFSYIVTPSLAMNTVLQQKTPDPRIRVLLVYYAGQKSIALKGQSSDRIVQRTLWRSSGLKAR